MTLNDVESNKEGKLAIGLLAILTTELYTDKTPDEVIKIANDRMTHMEVVE